jgi:hypothetical protein
MSMASLLLAEQGRHNRLISLTNFSDSLLARIMHKGWRAYRSE